MLQGVWIIEVLSWAIYSIILIFQERAILYVKLFIKTELCDIPDRMALLDSGTLFVIKLLPRWSLLPGFRLFNYPGLKIFP